MFIVHVGNVLLEKRQMPVKTFSPGSYFGATLMLGLHFVYAATYVAQQLCHLICVPRSCFCFASEQYPAKAAVMQMNESEKFAEKQLREAAYKISSKRQMWNRCERMLSVMRFEVNLKEIFEAWRKAAEMLQALDERMKLRDAQWNVNMSKWWQKHLEVKAQVNHRKHEEEMLKKSLGRSGQPIFPKIHGANVSFWMGQVPAALPDPLASAYSMTTERSARSTKPGTTVLGSNSLTNGGALTISSARTSSLAQPCSGLVKKVLWSARHKSPSAF